MARRLGLLAAVSLITGALTLGSTTPANACSARGVRSEMRANALEVVSLRTYHLELEADKDVYAIGEVAKIHVRVTRPAHEDPLGQGVPMDPPTTVPAEDANVGIGLRLGDVFLFGHNLTDAEGRTTVKIKIANYAEPGPATADAYSWKSALDLPCLRVEENGYTQVPNIFRILPARR